ncbi:ATP-dependent DNA ligase [Candidatus Pacearchaeota archaeon]|nr:ATP-dependent DNA ligase [Candidatus Pacearchaeota archaeon]
MQYQKLCEVYEELEKNPSRLKKTEILAEFLKSIKNEKHHEIVYLLQGRVWPDYEEKEFGISTQLTIKALARATGKQEEEIVKKWKKLGDIGEVAAEISKTKSQHTLFSTKLTTYKVLENLQALPGLVGKGTIDKKIGLIAELLSCSSHIEAKYITRTLMNDLRVGVGSGTLRDAIVWACFDKEDKEAFQKVQSAYDKVTDFALVFNKAIKGKHELDKIELSPGQPLKVMLAPKAESIKDAFERAGNEKGEIAIEYKYDGFRMLINKDEKGEIKIFTRRLDEVTKQFPDVVKYIREHIKADTFIIDSEAVGYNKKTKRYTSFQHISQRIKRKYDIAKLAEELPIEINVFDILYYNGKSMIQEPFEKRTALIHKIIKNNKFHIQTAHQLITSDEKKAEEFYKQALKDGQEGIMIKKLESPYQPGTRVGNWLKFKPVANELDLVIVGAEYGTGKRAGWLSSFDVACSDEDGKFLDIGKVSTGVKEKSEEGTSYEELTQILKPLITSETGKKVKIKPKIVITVDFQEIQGSPSYNSGFALRFPRFTALRTDRSVHDIATIDEVKKLHNKEVLKRTY